MMTKASFFMQEHLRRNFTYITDVHYPTAFFCRGRLPFPQGLSAIAILFHNKTPADVYAHPYFVEKQSDPSQPSPQLHITEEIQGIIKVQRGLRYMKDDSSKLDDTMSIVTDYDVPVRGQLLYVQTSREQEEARAEEERQLEERNRSLRPSGNATSRRPGEPTITFSSSLPGDGRAPGGEVTAEERAALHKRRIASRAFVSSFMYSGAGSGGASSGRMSGPASGGSGGSLFGDVEGRGGGGAAGSRTAGSSVGSGGGTGMMTPPAPNAPTLFPSVGESLRDKRANHGFFKAVLNQRMDERAVSAPVPPPQVHLHEDQDEAVLFKERVGGFTVAYNPIETNDRTFSDLMAKLNEEEKVVKVIVVPTRHAWRQVQLWADAFPDAAIVSSGPIPVLGEDGVLTSTDKLADAAAQTQVPAPSATPRGDVGALATAGHNGITGMQDFGNGVTGMSFPEVDLEAEEAAARAEEERQARKQQERQQRRESEQPQVAPSAAAAPADASQPNVGGAAPSARIMAMLEERERQRREGEQLEPPTARSATPKDPADFLWSQQARTVTSSAGFASEGAADLTDSRQGGLRIADAHRVRDLSREGSPDYVQLTPSIVLFRVKGDAITDEYVMYDFASKTLYCTDLFHGQYADLDPLNSWMCRVWFKFMKQGNHKRVDVVPRFKWRQVCAQGSLTELQTFVDWLTTSFEIENIVQSHGTPPFTEDAANALRLQWDLDPLPPKSMTAAADHGKASDRRGAFDWEESQQRTA